MMIYWKTFLTIFLSSFFFLAILSIFFLYWARGEKYLEGPVAGSLITVSVPAAQNPVSSTLTVLTWNIAFAQGRGSEGRAEVPQRSAQQMQAALSQMAEVLIKAKADVVFLQEVDFDSKRSYHVDQARFLAERAGYPFIFPAISWKVNYLPFPYWPPSLHYGKISSGGAILSKIPLTQTQNYFLPKPKSQSPLYQQFYVGRYSQKAQIEVNGKKYLLVNNHLESWDIPNKKEQVGLILDWLKTDPTPILALGGDLNTLPALAKKRDQFENEDNYVGDESLSLLYSGLTGLDEVQNNEMDRPESFTFPAWAPSRKLDHLFVPGRWSKKAQVLQTGDASDHLPLLVELNLGGS